MKTIASIVEDVRGTMGMSIVGNLLEQLNEWIGDKDEILAYGIDTKNDRVLVLTSNPDAYPEDDYSYKLTRFFPMAIAGAPGGTKWEVSVDISGQTAKGMMEQLLRESTKGF